MIIGDLRPEDLEDEVIRTQPSADYQSVKDTEPDTPIVLGPPPSQDKTPIVLGPPSGQDKTPIVLGPPSVQEVVTVSVSEDEVNNISRGETPPS